MDALFGGAVFDEWAVVTLTGDAGRLLTYFGPRREDFQKHFAKDTAELREEHEESLHGCGDFIFSRHAAGTEVDALMLVGKNLFLVCNNTSHSMYKISQNARWLSAQVPFVELSDKFRADPVVYPS